MGQLRAAVVGLGFIGLAHVEALRRLGVEVVGGLGSRPERTRERTEQAGIPTAYGSLDEVLADERVDVVHIASPNHAHAAQAQAVLDAGKHVVCEKPLGISTDETARLRDAAAGSGRVNAVCFNIRYYPLCRQMQQMVADGAIGPPRFVTGSYLQDWLLLDTDWNWRLDPSEAGQLRAVADIGSHWLDLAAHITGKRVVEVMADLHTFIPVRRRPEGPVQTFAQVDADQDLVEEEVGSDDAAGILLRFEDGTRGTLAVSQVAAGNKNSVRIEVDGQHAALSWWSEAPDQLWVGHRAKPNEELRRDASLLAPSAAGLTGFPGGHVEGFPDTFRALFSEVYRDVADGGPSEAPPYPTFADGHDVVAVTEAVARSAQEGRWVSVDR